MRSVINGGADPATLITTLDSHMANAFGSGAISINSTTAERTVSFGSFRLLYSYNSTYGLLGTLNLLRADATVLVHMYWHQGASQSPFWGGLANPGTQPLTIISTAGQVFIGRTYADGSNPSWSTIGKVNATTYGQAPASRAAPATLAASADTFHAYLYTNSSWSNSAGSRCIFTTGAGYSALLPVSTSLLANTGVIAQAAGAGATLCDATLENVPRLLSLFSTRGTGWSTALATLVPTKPATWTGNATTGYPVDFNSVLLADWQAAGLAEGDALSYDGVSYVVTCVPGLIVAA